MPDLEICGGWLDAEAVLSTMVYPSDPEKRSQLFNIGMSRRYEGLGKPIPDELCRLTVDWPSREQIEHEAKRRSQRASHAGAVVVIVHAMKELGIPEPGLKKAYRLQSHFARPEATGFLDHGPKVTSPRAIQQIFEEYRSVAHLWAALAYLVDRGSSSTYPDGRQVTLALVSSEVSQLLAFAEQYRAFGERFVASPKKSDRTLLRAEETFKVPDGYDLPPVEPPITYETMATWIAQALADEQLLPELPDD